MYISTCMLAKTKEFKQPTQLPWEVESDFVQSVSPISFYRATFYELFITITEISEGNRGNYIIFGRCKYCYLSDVFET